MHFVIINSRLKFPLKILALLFIFGGLIILRNRWFFAPRAIIAVPYLGSLLAFRTINYLYHHNHNFRHGPIALRLSYFLMLPNLVFLLFPIVDYRTYTETYYSRPAIEIYRKGALRLATGVLLLLIHRILYFYFSADPDAVGTPMEFLYYATITYLLIIQVIGLFVICIGWLTLFGFDLPAIFQNFFFSTGFSNLWRRINHYWRDFIIKVFYFPIFFRIRKIGHYKSMIIAGLTAFFFSWMLHSLQLYWISGRFSLSASDGVYWMTMGVFITADGIYQFKKGVSQKKRGVIAQILLLGIKITGIFLFSSLLWTLWYADSVSAWWFVFSKSFGGSTDELIVIPIIIGAAVLFFGIINYYFKPSPIRVSPLEKTVIPAGLASLFILLILFRWYALSLPATDSLAIVEENISSTKVNDIDREQVDLGYYDQLTDVGGIGRTGTQFRLFGDANWATGSGTTRATGDVLLRVFIPGAEGNHNGTHFSINSLGIRDRDYPVVPAAGTTRWVFLGTSYVLGAGVEKEESFEYLTEKILNDSLNKTGSGNLEILNYGMGGYMLTQQMALCRGKAFESKPDALFYFCHPNEANHVINNVARLVAYGVSLKDYTFLDSIVKVTGVKQSMSRPEMKERLAPYKYEIVRRGYLEIATACKAHNCKPVWVYLPTTTDEDSPESFATLSAIASQYGFEVLNLSSVFNGYRKQAIQVGEPDTHANYFGNQLIAKRLTAELRRQPALFKGTNK